MPRSHATAALALALAAFALAAPAPSRAADAPDYCGAGVHESEASGFAGFPAGNVFCPLIADPKAMRSFLTYQWGNFPAESHARTIGSVGVADGFALFRVNGFRAGEGLQLGLEAGVFAQFDLKTRSKDLMNADYLVGIPLTWRYRSFSARLRAYHQSSHLGDELMVHEGLQPSGLSFEALELLYSVELGPLRVYGGGEYLIDRVPALLGRRLAHGGAELRVGPRSGVRLVAAVDVKSVEQQNWKPGWAGTVGLELAHWSSPGHPPRLLSVVGQVYDGPSPYGQFLVEHTRFWGWGFQFQL